MSDRLYVKERKLISDLPLKLQKLAEEVEAVSISTDQSFHDAMCDIWESDSSSYNEEEIRMTLEAMGAYWD